MNTKLPLRSASEILGVSPDTIRRWEKKGLISAERTLGGHRRFDLEKLKSLKDAKKIKIPQIEFIRVINNPIPQLISRKPAIVSRLISFVIVSYSLIFIAQNPVVLADAIKDEFKPMGQVLGVSSTGGSNVTFGSTLDSNFNLSIKGVLNAGGVSGLPYNAFATSGQSATKTNVITTGNDVYIGGDLEVAGTTNLTGTISPTGFTPGSVLFINSLGALAQDNSGLFYDSTNKRLGVGTATPAAKLELNGGWLTSGAVGTAPLNELFGAWKNPGGGWARGIGWLSSSNSILAAVGAYGASDTLNYMYFGAGTNIWTNPWMVITSAGKVGIGTINPTNKLDISAGNIGLDNTQAILFKDTAGTFRSALEYTSINNLQVKNQGSSGSVQIGNMGNASNTTGAIQFYTNNSQERARIDASGNFGIGTTSPATRLHVASGTAGSATTLRVENTDNTNGNSHSILDLLVGGTSGGDPKVTFTGPAVSAWGIGTDNSDSDKFKISDSVNLETNTYMTLDTTGNVGIGTTTPSTSLDVRKDQNDLTIINVRNSIATGNTAAGAILQANSSNSSGFIGAFPSDYSSNTAFQKRLVMSTNSTATGITFYSATDTSQDIRFFSGSNTAERMRISSAGLVGIGNTSPVGLLDVSGAVTGKALAIFNETGDQAIFTASASGVAKFTIQHSGLVDATADGSSTKVVAGAIVDGSFTGTAVNGLMGIDSADGRFYFRYGGAWHYVAQTAGFQIPNYETFAYDFDTKSFDTNTPLKDGDFLIPFAEKHMDDGAVHGLYARIKDVADKIFKDVELVVNSLVTKKLIIDGTAGAEKVLAGTKEININNGNVDDKSLIYITATSSTGNHTLYLKEQHNGSFTVGFDDISDKDVSFNWWIVEAK